MDEIRKEGEGGDAREREGGHKAATARKGRGEGREGREGAVAEGGPVWI